MLGWSVGGLGEIRLGVGNGFAIWKRLGETYELVRSWEGVWGLRSLVMRGMEALGMGKAGRVGSVVGP